MTSKGYYNDKVLDKFGKALNDAKALVKSGDDIRVRFSDHNSKMGAIASVSTLPFFTCPDSCKGTCGVKCYAAKLANLRPSVLRSYAMNTAIAIYKPIEYWKQVNEYVKGCRFFRFHVSGDIMNKAYFHHMYDVAVSNPHCEILCFTKRYNVVNEWIDDGNDIPTNLHILFSGWTNLNPINPHNIPETNVIEKGCNPAENWTVCSGNCFNCAIGCAGCFNAKPGDTIAFHIH